ncbi:MAG: dTDP-4-dehydrorhamnose 3,5-epimerase family protein [Chloroflexota bacterium]
MSMRIVNRLAGIRAALGEAVVSGPLASDPMPGVSLRALTVNRDPRGTLTELLRSDWDGVYGPEMTFAQTYVSVTRPGIARDEDRWHVHERQTDRFVVLAGTIVVAVADARPGSPTEGRLLLALMQAEADAPAPYLLTVPPGTLHGLIALGDGPAMLQNFPTRLWDASDEGRVPFAEAGVTLADGAPFSWDLLRAALAGPWLAGGPGR